MIITLFSYANLMIFSSVFLLKTCPVGFPGLMITIALGLTPFRTAALYDAYNSSLVMVHLSFKK